MSLFQCIMVPAAHTAGKRKALGLTAIKSNARGTLRALRGATRIECATLCSQSQGRRIASFWELMRQYNVWQLVTALRLWQEAECEAKVRKMQGDLLVDRESTEGRYKPLLEYTQRECEELKLEAGIGRCEKFLIALRDGLTWSELDNQATVLREEIERELSFRRFAFVPKDKGEFWDKRSVFWGKVWEKFPNTKEDCERATDCYALEQNTACVFHLMRVAECGLRAVAKKLNVRLTDKGKPQRIEYADWEKVISAVKSKITATHGMPRGPRRQATLQFYSDAADQCAYIRDIWRNEVAHARGNYNEGEAFGVMTRVKQFMELLVDRIS